MDEYGNLGYSGYAEVYEQVGDLIIYQILDENGHQAYAEVQDIYGYTYFFIEPTQDGYYNVYDSFGNIMDAQILDSIKGDEYYFHDNSLVGQTIVIDDFGRINIIAEDGSIKSFMLEADTPSTTSMLSELALGVEGSTGRQLSSLEKTFTAVTLLSKSISGLSIIYNPISDALVAAGVDMADSMYDNIFANKEAYATALMNGMEAMGWGYNYFVNQSMEIGKRYAEDTWQNFLDISKGTAIREQRILDYANSLDYTNTSGVELENTVETSLSKVGTYDIFNRTQEEEARKNEWRIIRSLEDYVKKDGSSPEMRDEILNKSLQYVTPQKNQSFNDMFLYVNENVKDPSSGDIGVKQGVNATMDLVKTIVETHTGTPQVMRLEDKYQRLNKLYNDIKNELAEYETQ